MELQVLTKDELETIGYEIYGSEDSFHVEKWNMIVQGFWINARKKLYISAYELNVRLIEKNNKEDL